jgi:hypothetical protein
MATLRLSFTEKIILILVAMVLAAGFVLRFTNLSLFESFVREDGVVEWFTVAGLLLVSFFCFARFAKLLRHKKAWFLFVTFMLGLFLFFAAGEEISWGQRIFGLATPEYFQKNNAQQETNLHNLVVGGVKINKLVFSVILTAVLGIFLLVLPWLYQKSRAVQRFIDRSAVPVPQWYQVIAFLLVFGLASLIPHEKNAEVLECGAALLFFLVVAWPRNKAIFSAHG